MFVISLLQTVDLQAPFLCVTPLVRKQPTYGVFHVSEIWYRQRFVNEDDTPRAYACVQRYRIASVSDNMLSPIRIHLSPHLFLRFLRFLAMVHSSDIKFYLFTHAGAANNDFRQH